MPHVRSRTHARLSAALLVTCLFATGCDELKGDPKATFRNESNSNSTYNILIDGTEVGAISPFQELTRKVSEGKHEFTWKFANSGGTACFGSWTFDAGDEETFTCNQ